MSKVEETLEQSEENRVFAWRYEVLLREGLEDVEATLVALGDFDLHRAVRMLRSGCSSDLLVEIAS